MKILKHWKYVITLKKYRRYAFQERLHHAFQMCKRSDVLFKWRKYVAAQKVIKRFHDIILWCCLRHSFNRWFRKYRILTDQMALSHRVRNILSHRYYITTHKSMQLYFACWKLKYFVTIQRQYVYNKLSLQSCLTQWHLLIRSIRHYDRKLLLQTMYIWRMTVMRRRNTYPSVYRIRGAAMALETWWVTWISLRWWRKPNLTHV